jgi:hypothetical protein
MFKKIIAVASCIFTLATMSTPCAAYSGEINHQPNIYPQTLIIDEVNQNDDIVTGHTLCGLSFSFYGSEDWLSGDVAALIMSDNGTPDTVLDDIIITARYVGYVDLIK